MNGRKKTKQLDTNLKIGKIIRSKLKESKHTVVWFAGQLECSRTNVYKIFAKHSINTDELLKISDILDFDFFKIYSDKLNDKN